MAFNTLEAPRFCSTGGWAESAAVDVDDALGGCKGGLEDEEEEPGESRGRRESGECGTLLLLMLLMAPLLL